VAVSDGAHSRALTRWNLHEHWRAGSARQLLGASFLFLAYSCSPPESEDLMEFGKRYVLCSAFKGTLVDIAGKPVTGTRIERTWQWAWKNESGSDHTTTDANGRFSLPQVTGKSLSAGLFTHEPLIAQKITASGPSGPVVLWSYVKRDYAENGELAGRPLHVVCGIEQAPAGKLLYNGTCVEAAGSSKTDDQTH